MATVAVNGTELAYLEAGQGEVVIFIHGSLGDLRAWAMQTEVFSEHFRTIAYSRRYHHPNPWSGDGSDYSPMLHADDLATFMNTLGIRNAHIIGSSYGAYTALFLALRHPERVRSLVLGEPPVLPLLEQNLEGRAIYATFEADVLVPVREAFRRGELEQGIETFIDGVIGKGTYAQTPAFIHAFWSDNARAMQAEMLAPDYFPMPSPEEVRQLTVPTLLLTGEHTPRMFYLITDELERLLPNSERVMIPATSHAIHAGNPQAYNETVLAFLAQQS